MKTFADVVREKPGDFAAQAAALRETLHELDIQRARIQGALWAIEAQIELPNAGASGTDRVPA